MVGLLGGLSVFFVVMGTFFWSTQRQRKMDAVIFHNGLEDTEKGDGILGMLANWMAPAAVFVLTPERRKKVETMLEDAGQSQTPEQWVAKQLAGGTIGTVIGALGFMTGPLGLFSLLFFGFLGAMQPQMALKRKTKEKQQDIEKDIGPFVDLLALMLETGSSLYEGIRKSGVAVGGSLGREMDALIRQSYRQGFTEALHQTTGRIGNPAMDGLSTILSQATRYGTGMDIVRALRQYSSALRTSRHNQMEKEVQKMSTKIMFPMFLLIFAPMMVILFAPVLASFGQSGVF